MSKPLETASPAEGSVDWRAAEAFALGGAGADESEAGEGAAPEAAEVREFKYRGKTVKVDPDTYSLLEDLKREARGANGRLGSELARTRERLAKLEGVLATSQTETRSTEPEPTPPDPLLATRDIAAWQRQYDDYHTAKMVRHQKRLEQEYLAKVRDAETRIAEQRKDAEWADRFYSSYDHLDHPEIKPVVSQVYIEHKSEIDALGDDVEAAHERLAELADARLVRLKQAGTGAETTNNRRPPRIESAAGATPRRTVEDKPREFSAASWVARQRLKMSGRELPKDK